MVCQMANVPFVDIAVTRKGRLVLHCDLGFGESMHASKGDENADDTMPVQVKVFSNSAAQDAAVYQAASRSMPRAHAWASVNMFTQLSSGPHSCGSVGPVSGISSNAGGGVVAHVPTNQNTEQHRCDAV